MKYLLVSLIIFFSISSWSLNINLKKSIVVGGQPSINIKLIHIIEPSTNLIKVSDLIAEINFTDIKSNEAIELNRIDIVKKLKELKKNHRFLSDVNFVIPNKINISHTGYNINTRVVVESLKRSWTQKCISCKFVVDSIVLPELTSEYKNEPWFIQASSNMPKGRFSSQIIFPNVSNPASTWVTGQAHSKKPVLVIGQNLDKGEFIASTNLKYEFRGLNKLRGAITNLENLKHKVTNKYLMSGDVVKSSNLSDKVVFRRGESVRLVYLEDGLRIVTTAISDSMGKVGQSAWVKNLKSKKRIAGVVLETGEVLVQ